MSYILEKLKKKKVQPVYLLVLNMYFLILTHMNMYLIAVKDIATEDECVF